MGELIGLGFISAFLSAIIGIIVLIVFFVMASDIGKIKRKLRTVYFCKHCGFKTKQYFDFCPVCDKNDKGETLQELRQKYM